MRIRALAALPVALLAACGGASPPHAQQDAGPSCAELAQQYFDVADDRNYCAADADCVAYPSECGIEVYAGRVDCYIVINASSDKTPFATIARAWSQLGCRECMFSCAGPPSFVCVGGKCALAAGDGGCADAGCP
ncbi:MAG TPA: hypothetical protein VGQ83_00690 [Polyangia bacterium]|jgi:hypothetical protein